MFPQINTLFKQIHKTCFTNKHSFDTNKHSFYTKIIMQRVYTIAQSKFTMLYF